MPDDELDPTEQDAYALFSKYVNTSGLEAFLIEELAELYSALNGLPSKEALEFAKEVAASKVAQISEATKRDLAREIVKGVQTGLSPDQIARSLHDSIGLDSQRKASLEKYKASLMKQNLSDKEIKRLVSKEAERLLKDRAGVIAQNELRQAVAAGNMANAKEEGATHKVSISAGDSRVAAMCIANEAAGVIPIDEAFPGSGTMTVPHHPRCRCAVSYFTEPDKSYIDKLNIEAKEKTEEIKKAQQEETQ